MSAEQSEEFLIRLVSEVRKFKKETEWVEFKHNNCNPEEIGECISALSNSAALNGMPYGYVIWGVDDETHEVVGTLFDPKLEKKGNTELETWLTFVLSPRIDFHFHQVQVDGKQVSLVQVPRAMTRPTQFKGTEYIRIGSYNQKLKDHPEKERALWKIFDRVPFEELIAMEGVAGSDVLALLDYPSYFDLLRLPLPDGAEKIIQRFIEDKLIVSDGTSKFNILNLGAILFAKDLKQFKRLGRKAIRLITYKGKDKLDTLREDPGKKGYASGFSNLIDFLNARLPRNEVIGQGIRKDVPMYPIPAIRELLANALIHQDFSVTGTGPTIEIFSDRMEITNPGEPLVDVKHFIDASPRSRNEILAAFMRRIGICEERGSGIDKVVWQTEYYQLPAPIFETREKFTRAILFSHKEFRDMDRADRVRACYLHACLKWISRDFMTNGSLRARFKIEERNSAIVSRIIHDAIEDGLIKPYDPDQSRKYSKYVPFWA